ncbi:hypothetical protein Rsub_10371 [Raphidocelis subcapitata]|uniref:SGNH hydrolase-type esterase domain-containing protein n=1 Tax=Raphidocelis subcapitata TaxID=307507 RepID=A0A2V0PC66_9CHLO|nr:hypothetical protein Rsub_10371 [Raphidocelis subcapitata]|eukprot:GBF97448.1 hypothetical protein Rsub_10371 [Raphidocelis subcapitata]
MTLFCACCAPPVAGGCGARKLLCLGDSHTEAILGTDWVGRLANATKGLVDVVRAGKSGEWAVLIGRRLGPLLDANPNPAGLVILAGTNDVLAATSPAMMAQYRWLFPGLRGQVATLESYTAEIERMLSTIAARAPNCKVAVVSLPPIGEDMGDAVNAAVGRYNAALAEVVARHAPRARLVDFHAACQRRLEAARREGARRPPPFGLMSTAGFLRLQVGAPVLRYVLRWSWQDLSRWNSLELLTDQVHLNDQAGELLLKELDPFVKELTAAK